MSELLLPNDLKIHLHPQLNQDDLEKEIFEQFQTLADELINHYCIIKSSDGSSPKTVYHFMELEFYYCSPEHPDLITYPRKAEAGDWFFHASGVDICLESKVELNPETGKVLSRPASYGFGGILVRALSKQIEGEETTFVTGPLNCCYELFDKFSAFHSPSNFPIIVKDNHSEKGSHPSCGRYFHFSTSLDDKLRNIYQEHWETEKDDRKIQTETFERYLKKPYCFFDEEAFRAYRKFKGVHKAYNAIPSKENHSRLKAK